MKNITRNLVFIFFIAFFHISCEKDKMEMSLEKIHTCHDDMNWDVERIKNAMIGEWVWIHSYCTFIGLLDVPDDSISFDFKDSLVTIHDQGVLVQTSVWSIDLDPLGYFVINLEPSASQFQGEIYMCKDEMTSKDNLFTDGCEHFFERQE